MRKTFRILALSAAAALACGGALAQSGTGTGSGTSAGGQGGASGTPSNNNPTTSGPTAGSTGTTGSTATGTGTTGVDRTAHRHGTDRLRADDRRDRHDRIVGTTTGSPPPSANGGPTSGSGSQRARRQHGSGTTGSGSTHERIVDVDRHGDDALVRVARAPTATDGRQRGLRPPRFSAVLAQRCAVRVAAAPNTAARGFVSGST